MGSSRKKLCPRLICRYQHQGQGGSLCGQDDGLLTVCQWEMDGGCEPDACPALQAGRSGPEARPIWARSPRAERVAALTAYFRRLFRGGSRR